MEFKDYKPEELIGKKVKVVSGTVYRRRIETSIITRVTPLECFRLFGFPDDFIKPVSETQQYKQAGNSIVVNVMEAIFKSIFKVWSMV